jgi:hypothetical protein
MPEDNGLVRIEMSNPGSLRLEPKDDTDGNKEQEGWRLQ